jgi:phosphate transport system permease protein
MQKETSRFNRRLTYRKALSSVFYVLFLGSVVFGIAGLLLLLGQVLWQGLPWLNWNFVSSYPSRHPEEAGLLSALMGSVWLILHPRGRGRGHLSGRVRGQELADASH